MELIQREMPNSYILVDSGDWHKGPLNHYQKGFLEMIERVKKTKNCFLFGKGDMVDAVTVTDKRFSVNSINHDNLLLTPQQQINETVEDLYPIKNKILGCLLGNHEYKLINSIDILKEICDKLTVPYGGVCAKFIAKYDKKIIHKMFFMHGRKLYTSRSKDQLQKLANQKAALKLALVETGHTDCIYMSAAHAHKLIKVDPTVSDEIMLTDNGTNLQQDYRVEARQNSKYIPPECRWYGCSGSFLRTYSPPGSQAISYSEVAGYGPSEMGWLEVHVKNKEVVKVEKIVVG